MPVDQALIVAGLRVFGGVMRRRGVPRDPATGTIDLVNQRVRVDPWTYRGKLPHPKHAWNVFREWGRRKLQSKLTAYLQGGPLTVKRNRVNRPLIDAIEQERDAMRLRPQTPIESVGFGSGTPALMAMQSALFGSRRRPAARRRKRRAAPRRARRRAPARARARPAKRRAARLVRGSAAAKAWGRKMRRLRRR